MYETCNHLRKRKRLSMNTTPYKYLTEYRLSKAAQLLKKRMNLSEILPLLLGFIK